MRRPLLLVSLLLAGCNDRRSFDERYDDTQRNLEQRAANLDAAVNVAGSESATNEANH
jgi:hypothetical protein